NDIVLGHGDFVLPNVIVNESYITGSIDVINIGLRDRYVDIASMVKSIEETIGPEYVEHFYTFDHARNINVTVAQTDIDHIDAACNITFIHNDIRQHKISVTENDVIVHFIFFIIKYERTVFDLGLM